jgi:Tfp pilus assembly protein PilF
MMPVEVVVMRHNTKSKKQPALWGVFLLSICLLVQAKDAFQEKYTDEQSVIVDQAKSLRLAQDFDAAIALLKPLLEREPEFYRAMYQLALACAERAQSPAKKDADIANADKWFQKALALHEQASTTEKPIEEYTIFNSYGWFLIENSRFDEAEKTLQKGLAVIEKLPSVQSQQRVLNNLALVYKQQQRFEEAEAVAKRAVDLGSITAQKHYGEIQQILRTKSTMKE